MNFFENQWVEVFKAGEQTDSSGITRVWTNQDLNKITNTYNEQKAHEAPLVVGHPKDNSPAFGWVEELKNDGKSLFAKFKQIIPEFKEAVEKGMYKKRSISLYPDLTLRHIGFLGAKPPAIKGLEDIKFNEVGESIYIEYNEKGETFMSKEELAKLELNFSEKIKAMEIKNCELEKKLMGFVEPKQEPKEEPKEENKDFAEALGEIAKLKAEVDKQKQLNRIASFKEYVGGLHAEGKIVTNRQNDIIDLMEAINTIGVANFSEGEANALDKFKSYLENQPKLVQFGESVLKDKKLENSPEILLDKAAKEIAKEQNISYSEALIQASEQNLNLEITI